MQKTTKSQTLKLRITADEHSRLAARAKSKGGVSAFVRKRIFSGSDAIESAKSETLLLTRMHSTLLMMARAMEDRQFQLQTIPVLAHLVAIERGLTQLLLRKNT